MAEIGGSKRASCVMTPTGQQGCGEHQWTMAFLCLFDPCIVSLAVYMLMRVPGVGVECCRPYVACPCHLSSIYFRIVY